MMRRHRNLLDARRLMLFCLLIAIGALAIAQICEAASIVSASLTHQGAISELHFGLDSPAPKLQLSAHGNELWIDLNRTTVQIPARPLYGREVAPVSIVRAIGLDGGHARIEVEVTGRSDYAIVQRPHEIVLRVALAGQVADLRIPPLVEHRKTVRTVTTSHVEPVAIHAPSPQYSSPIGVVPGSFLVMIDAGHGGYDPGTQSAGGILEKDLALDIARRLADALKARGVRTQFTRDSDDFISLPERTRRANLANADLFVSIHLDSSPNSDTTGIEVYYLNNTTDRATIRLARMENAGVTGASAPRDGDLNYILADLRQNYKANEAASLARMIDTQTVTDLDRDLRLQVNPLGAKMGPFYVLVGAHMPAVLVECGFLSNPIEAGRLSTPQYQDTLAQGIAGAVVQYLGNEATAGNL